MATLVLSALTDWVESPRYAPITIRVPVDLVVKVTVQLAELPRASSTPMPDKLQLRREGMIKFMEKRNRACPVGVMGEEPVSVTVIVHVTASLTVPGFGPQEMEVRVLSFPPPAVPIVNVPELPKSSNGPQGFVRSLDFLRESSHKPARNGNIPSFRP